MSDVVARLGTRTRATLQHVRYAGRGMAPILRYDGEASVFSFRDFGSEALEWRADGSITAGDVEYALRELLLAMYDSSVLVGLDWQSRLLAVIDNHRVFHGRTVMRRDRAGGDRLLRRIRVGPAASTKATRESVKDERQA